MTLGETRLVGVGFISTTESDLVVTCLLGRFTAFFSGGNTVSRAGTNKK